MTNLIELNHIFYSTPDIVTVELNNQVIYCGSADVRKINFIPQHGLNILTVTLNKKSSGNFMYDSQTNRVLKDSSVTVKEIIVENRYFRSLITKCGLVEVDISKNLSFPSKYIEHDNCLCMEGSIYLIKFEYPIKNWMQIHLHGTDLSKIIMTHQELYHEFNSNK
jgi:hypothetical protein